MSTLKLKLTPGELTLADLRRIFYQPVLLTVDEGAWSGVLRARQTVETVIDSDSVAYGVNTGFGRLAQTRIDVHQLAGLQENLLLSHATGVGKLLDDDTVRLVLVMKINALMRGYSGVRREVIEFLIDLLNRDLYPAIPSKGSVGASGDLAPLAHLSLPLIGRGKNPRRR